MHVATGREVANRHGTDPLGGYLRDLQRFGLLSGADETRLAQQMERGRAARERLQHGGLSTIERHDLRSISLRGEDARRTFVESNLRLVVSIAKTYPSVVVPLLDRIQDGNVGLIQAVDGFDWRRECKFSTYAHWPIRKAISRGTYNNGRTIRLPDPALAILRPLRTARSRLELSLRRPASIAELAVEMNLPRDRIADVLRCEEEPRSLGQPLRGHADGALEDLIEDADALPLLDTVILGLMRDEVRTLVKTLDERERQIISLRFGLDGEGSHTLEEIGKAFGLTRERIRQIEARAKAKLRERGDAIHTLLETKSSQLETHTTADRR
jgi:RNA polymerase sigma factor (sigma-70 family)